MKRNCVPLCRNKTLFRSIPVFGLLLSLLLWAIYPDPQAIRLKNSILWYLCLTALGVYLLLGAGWGRNRKYSVLGGVRSVAQSISYEVCLFLIVLHNIFYFHYDITERMMTCLSLFLFLQMILFFMVALAETNRSPFDFSEGESELVSGFNTEFASAPFVMIFLAEYTSILFISLSIALLFIMTNTWDAITAAMLWASAFIWRRGTLPRLRYDQLISLAWKRVLPLVLTTCSLLVC